MRALFCLLLLLSLAGCKTFLKASDADPAAPLDPRDQMVSVMPSKPEQTGESGKPKAEEPNIPAAGGGSDALPGGTGPGGDSGNQTGGGSQTGGDSGNQTGGGTGGTGGDSGNQNGGGTGGTGGDSGNQTGGGTGGTGGDSGNQTGGGTGGDSGNQTGGGTGDDSGNQNGGDNAGQNGGGGTTPPPECIAYNIDFEKRPNGTKISNGETISNQYADWGISVISHRRKSDGSMETNTSPIIFDSAQRPNAEEMKAYESVSKTYGGNDDGFDGDLTTVSNGNVLIIAENFHSKDGSGFVSYPDDNYWGGQIKLFFTKPTRIVNVDIVDNESPAAKLEFFDKSYNFQFGQQVPAKANGSLTNIAIGDARYFHKMTLSLPSGGAIDNIRICIKAE